MIEIIRAAAVHKVKRKQMQRLIIVMLGCQSAEMRLQQAVMFPERLHDFIA